MKKGRGKFRITDCVIMRSVSNNARFSRIIRARRYRYWLKMADWIRSDQIESVCNR